jgi:hypothetical protein
MSITWTSLRVLALFALTGAPSVANAAADAVLPTPTFVEDDPATVRRRDPRQQ